MRVATWNIHRGRGAFGRFRPELVAAVIAEIAPDVIALQEAQHWLRPGRAMLDAALLERHCGLLPVAVTGRPGEQGWRSNVLLARAGVRLAAPPRGLRLGGWEPRGAILAELDLGRGPFRLLAAHLSLGAARRRRQAAAMLGALEGLPPLPLLLLGDLNEARAGGAALAVLAGRFALPPTPPAFPAFRPMLALDRILADPPWMLSDLVVHDTKAARRASDHLPLVARVEIGADPAS
jgi:endonuclease/exonuclease/phosphatase family metal-dependent hydrolase